MKTSENIRINQLLESQLELAQYEHKFKSLDLHQDRLTAAFWATLLALPAVVYVLFCL